MRIGLEMNPDAGAIPQLLRFGSGGRGRNRNVRHALDVYLAGNILHLTLRGQVEAVALVDDLNRVISSARSADCLTLDISQTQGVDHLSLSAILVVLRRNANVMRAMTLKGLPPWARLRIYQTGAEHILGQDWVLVWNSQKLEFRLSGRA